MMKQNQNLCQYEDILGHVKIYTMLTEGWGRGVGEGSSTLVTSSAENDPVWLHWILLKFVHWGLLSRTGILRMALQEFLLLPIKRNPESVGHMSFPPIFSSFSSFEM